MRIEYKGDWNPEPILHSICAFANDIDNWGGGHIIIGIEEENGMPKLPVKGLSKSSIDRPYKCPIAFPTEKAAKSEKVYDIRMMSNSIRANQREEKEMFMPANNQPYDDGPNPAARTEDLKSSLISEFLYAVKSDLYERSLTQPALE